MEDPLPICRDCNLNRVDLEQLRRFEAAVNRNAHMPRAIYLRRQANVLRITRARYARKKSVAPEVFARQYTRAYNHLVDLEQIWFRNHPEDYKSRWDRVSGVLAGPEEAS